MDVEVLFVGIPKPVVFKDVTELYVIGRTVNIFTGNTRHLYRQETVKSFRKLESQAETVAPAAVSDAAQNKGEP